jgi:hypothetical protein
MWRPIETAPRDGTRVLLLSADRRVWPVKIGEYVDDPPRFTGWVSDNGEEELWTHPWQPTHWMPLPDDPENPA